MQITVPVCCLTDPVLCSDGIGEIADDARLLKRLLIDRDKADADGFEALVDIDAESDTLHIGCTQFQICDVLLHFGKAGILVKPGNVVPKFDQSLRLDVLIGQAVPQGFYGFDITVQVIETTKEMRQTQFLVGGFMHGGKILHELNLVEQLH